MHMSCAPVIGTGRAIVESVPGFKVLEAGVVPLPFTSACINSTDTFHKGDDAVAAHGLALNRFDATTSPVH